MNFIIFRNFLELFRIYLKLFSIFKRIKMNEKLFLISRADVAERRHVVASTCDTCACVCARVCAHVCTHVCTCESD